MIILLLVFNLVFPVCAYANTLFSEDFETLPTITDLFTESGNTGVITSSSNKGRNSMRTFLDRDVHANAFRTEVTIKDAIFPFGVDHLEFNRTYEIEFKMYLDDAFVQDTTAEIFCQMHGEADGGESSRPPNMGFLLSGNGTTTDYIIRVRGDTNKTTTVITTDETYNIGSADGDIGTWVQWKVQVYLSYQAAAGWIKIWKDGTLVVNASGLETGYNDDVGPYWKFGIYKWPWDPADVEYVSGSTGAEERIQYYDDIIIRVNNIGVMGGAMIGGTMQ